MAAVKENEIMAEDAAGKMALTMKGKNHTLSLTRDYQLNMYMCIYVNRCNHG